MTNIEYPGLIWVKDPVNFETGKRTGARPRMRHHEDCWHLKDDDGRPIGPPPYRASEEQMRTLPACKTCAGETGGGSARPRSAADRRVGEICPTCFQELPVKGQCQNCM